MQIQESIDYAARLLSKADALLIGAGAGMGVDSGLPDFRGNAGLWRAYPRLGKHRIDLMEIANPASFDDDPRLAWGFYGHRLNLYRDTIPHEGFHILQRIAATLPLGSFVYTSNVDGQFQKAGFDPFKIVECHGSIHYLQCCSPCSSDIWEATNYRPTIDEENCQLLSDFPTCLSCHGLARPNILMFNDYGWVPERTENQYSALHHWHQQAKNLVIIELGAGIHIPAVRHACESFLRPIIRINPAYPEVPKKEDVGIALGALEALQRIWQALTAIREST